MYDVPGRPLLAADRRPTGSRALDLALRVVVALLGLPAQPRPQKQPRKLKTALRMKKGRFPEGNRPKEFRLLLLTRKSRVRRLLPFPSLLPGFPKLGLPHSISGHVE